MKIVVLYFCGDVVVLVLVLQVLLLRILLLLRVDCVMSRTVIQLFNRNFNDVF